MTAKPQTYPAVYIIFTLLNAIRRGIERKKIWREFRRQKIALQPRLSFWLSVCAEAGLVREVSESRLRVTSHVQAWLKKTPEEQALHLIDSWQNAPHNRRVRLFRKKLLWKLKYNQPLTQKDSRALKGLDALGLTANGQLTKWGEILIQDKEPPPTSKVVEPCISQEDEFIARLPHHLCLLWDLERYLRPKAPGVYPLTKRALQFHEGDPSGLIELLERGLAKPVPARTRALILQQPSIRIAEGVVLEFSSPAELKQLRRQPVFRKTIDEFLSPQRVLVSRDKTNRLIKMLARRGVYLHQDGEPAEGLPRTKRTHFPSKPGIPLQPLGKSVPVLTILEKYRQLGQALDILYRMPGYPAEHRRITPLLIENRGEHTYVIAYCQTRRAQRTFRLDRMEVAGTY